MRSFCRVTILLLATSLSVLQAPSGFSQTLHKEQLFDAPAIGGTNALPVHCDSSGDVYIQHFQSPLTEVTWEGKRAAIFDTSVARLYGLADLDIKNSFAVDAEGRVYVLARTRGEYPVILKFDNDGTYSGSVAIDHQYDPQQLVHFSNDTFLISGVYLKTGGSSAKTGQFIGLFDDRGSLIKNVDISSPEPRASAAGKASKSEASPRIVGPADLGIMESDGTNAFLLMQGSQPQVLVISSRGELVRRLNLIPPPPAKPDKKDYLQADALRVHSGEILVEYFEPRAHPNGNAANYIVRYDAADGHLIGKYTLGTKVNGSLACTDWNGRFSFLSWGPHGPALLIAGTR